jgi:hypothetical protein
MHWTLNRLSKQSKTHLHAGTQHFAQKQVVDECHAILGGPVCTATQQPNQQTAWSQYGGWEQAQAEHVADGAKLSKQRAHSM